ncbi:MAG: zinc-ribbon domain-containing protein [Firmicutes bacterium]|nr:zinc-ribbon domain-containing protein [Bacillota bacterium]
MFLLYFADMPVREVKAEEIRFCKACGKETKHRYEEISFHARMLMINVFCKKKRYVRICSVCNNGEEMEKDTFNQQVERLIYPVGIPQDMSQDMRRRESDDDPDSPKYRVGKKKGIKYCRQCGEKIFPDIGYCTSCAVRGNNPGGPSGMGRR